jgi:integrase/recombinase XerD
LLGTENDRDHTLATVALLAGLRVSEIVNLRVEDIDFEESTLMVVEGKGRKDRMVLMPSRLAMTLREWIGDRTEGYVFPATRATHGATGHLSQRTVQRIVKDAAARAGIPRHITPHKLRHTYATKALRAGLSLREVQELLGHASVATTEIYCHVVVDDKVKTALERL